MVLCGIHFHKRWTWDAAMPTWHRRTSTPSTSWVAQAVTHFCHVSNLKKCLTSDIQQVAGNLKIWILNCAPRKGKWLLKLNANKRFIVDWTLLTLTIDSNLALLGWAFQTQPPAPGASKVYTEYNHQQTTPLLRMAAKAGGATLNFNIGVLGHVDRFASYNFDSFSS